MKFRVKVGTHIQNDPVIGSDGKQAFNDRGEPVFREGIYRSEMLGGPDIVETDTDLCARFNVFDTIKTADGLVKRANDRYMPKFERIYEHQQPAHQHSFPGQTPLHQGAASSPSVPGGAPPQAVKNVPNLDQMNLKQLQDWAAAEEIDLRGAAKREDVLKLLKSAVGR